MYRAKVSRIKSRQLSLLFHPGSFFDNETAPKRCAERPNSDYKNVPCSERTEEIETFIPDYQSQTGICVIHCQEEEEIIWNIYTENPEASCIGFDLFYPGDEALPQNRESVNR